MTLEWPLAETPTHAGHRRRSIPTSTTTVVIALRDMIKLICARTGIAREGVLLRRSCGRPPTCACDPGGRRRTGCRTSCWKKSTRVCVAAPAARQPVARLALHRLVARPPRSRPVSGAALRCRVRRPVSARRIRRHQPNRPIAVRHLFAAVRWPLSAIGYAMDGYDLLILGFMLRAICAELHLTPPQRRFADHLDADRRRCRRHPVRHPERLLRYVPAS